MLLQGRGPCCDRSFNEAFNQAMKLEAAKATAGKPAVRLRMRGVTRISMGTQPLPAERPVC
jgi:hypothetical protein